MNIHTWDQAIRQRAKKEPVPLPPDLSARVEQTLHALAPRPQGKKRRAAPVFRIAAAAAAALLLILPNVSGTLAYAMQSLPILGPVVEILTIRNYSYDDGYHNARVDVPQLQTEDDTLQGSVDSINDDVTALTDALVQRFKKDSQELKNSGHTALDIRYQVMTNTETWFTLRIQVWEGSGSSNTYYHYYHINKRTGAIVTLPDLFPGGSQYVSLISANIRSQMRQQMADDSGTVYWLDSETPEWDFQQIAADQNFYFAENGDLVIAFNKYEVAPGSMGCPTFQIAQSVCQPALHP